MSDGRDLLAGEPASGGGRDLLASPKIPASSAPTFPKKAEAAIYGLATFLVYHSRLICELTSSAIEYQG